MAQFLESAGASQAYWNKAAESYDRDFTDTNIGRLWRRAVWVELDRGFNPGQHVLELNCGTGIDALHLAERGIRVLACDLSSRMIKLAQHRAASSSCNHRLDFRVIPTEMIGILEPECLFDGAFSNFSGLNCVNDLSAVASELSRLLNPGAKLYLCMLGRYSAWDSLRNLFHGNFRRLFQRLPENTAAVSVRYMSRHEIVRTFSPRFTLCDWKGIGIILPPSYMELWAQRHPRLTNFLARIDNAVSRVFPLRNMGSCILLEFQRTSSRAQ